VIALDLALNLLTAYICVLVTAYAYWGLWAMVGWVMGWEKEA